MEYRTPRATRAGVAALLAIGLVAPLALPGRDALAADDARKIAWRDDLAQAQAEAKSRGLLVWIQFTGPWCINCRRMDRSTFVHAPVVASSRDQFVPVKLRSDEYENLAQSLGLTMLPSTVIVRPTGEVVEKFEGYGEAEEFGGFLAGVLHREGRSPEQLAAKAKARSGQDAAVGLAGYCPVSLIQDRRLVPGKPDLTVEHDGRLFRFANAEGKAAFLRRPGQFTPVNDGRSPVSQVDRGDFLTGDPRWGVVYGGHLFLFKDAAERDRFVKDPDRYAHIDADDRGACPHCWNRAKLAGRPWSRSSATASRHELPPVAPPRVEALLAPTDTVRR